MHILIKDDKTIYSTQEIMQVEGSQIMELKDEDYEGLVKGEKYLKNSKGVYSLSNKKQ